MIKWKETTLGEISSNISYGFTASAKAENVGPKFLRITDIVPNRINWDTVPHCIADAATSEKYLLNVGDIVIARTGATTGFNKTIKNVPYESIYASYLIRYQIDETQADPDYIGHVLQSLNWFAFIKAIAGGSAQPGANAKQLASYEILLPPLPEQRAIADVLSSLDDKIDLLYRQNETLEALAQTLFRHWFIEEAEDDWEEGTLEDLVEFNYGKGLKKSIRSGTGYPVVGSSGIVDYHSEYLIEGPGIVTGRKGTLGKVIYLSDDFYPIDTTFFIKTKNDSPNLYYEYFLLKSIGFENMNTDSAVPGLNRNNALSVEVIIPPQYIITLFNDFVHPLFQKRRSNKEQIHTIEKLRDMLLPKLISGEVQVQMEV